MVFLGKMGIIIFMLLSYLAFGATIYRGFKEYEIRHTPKKNKKDAILSKLILPGLFFLSVLLFHFAVGISSIVSAAKAGEYLWFLEEIFNSLFESIRTFSLEEDYGAYVDGIKNMITVLLPEPLWLRRFLQNAAIWYASGLNVLALIVGGAVILNVLSDIFPKVELRIAYSNSRPKYFFSELNPASLALAKSIREEWREEDGAAPILIFTDAYIDDEKEKDYELFLEARQYGAICIRDDLSHVAKPSSGKREYYLMDENEIGNFQTLLALSEEENIRYLADSNVYLFVQTDAYVQIEEEVRKRLERHNKDGANKTIICPINSYRNLAQNLLTEVPLYEPVVHTGDNKLTVTIFGNGTIGTEAFLSIYWFGQMMRATDDTMELFEVTVNVVSQDEEAVFWNKIDYINPEIKRTTDGFWNGGYHETGDILCWNRAGEKTPPYFKVRYTKADVKIGSFWTEQTKDLLKSDYFIVALGTDADNISVAEKIRCAVGTDHLEKAKSSRRAVIAYAVFDPLLADALNGKKHYSSREKNKYDIYMHAFGSLDQVYSCDNVQMSKHKKWADAVGEAYDRQRWADVAKDNKKRVEKKKGNYNYWADLARAMHLKYKVFSLGWIESSVFDAEDPKAHQKAVEERCQLYQRLAKKEHTDADSQWRTDIQNKKEIMAWLEHRRWNAFTRTMGYRYTDKMAQNFSLNGEDGKNLDLRLHPCLVEAQMPTLKGKETYMREKMKPLFNPASTQEDKWKAYSELTAEERDRLDIVTCRMFKLAYEFNAAKDETTDSVYCYDYKTYDYYDHEFDK